MILHTVNALPGSNSLDDCLRCAQHGDTILLLGDGVYNALSGSVSCHALQACPAQVVILDTDAAAAGISDRLADIPVVNMDDFVALSEEYPRQLAWF